MRIKRTIILMALSMLCGCARLSAVQVFRVDPIPVLTTSGTTPPSGQAPVYAVPGSTISVCQDSMCATPQLTYTDSSGTVTCPTNAGVTLPGTSLCRSTTGAQGQFGFWLPIANAVYYYKIRMPSGAIFGPYPLSVGFSVAGVSSVTAGAGISVSAGTGDITVSNAGVLSFNSRTGAVTPTTGDYSYSQISGAVQGNSGTPQMAGFNSGVLGALLCNDLFGNATTVGCVGGGGGGSGTVMSVGLLGTANQITVTGASPITTSGSWTLSLPVTFPTLGSVTDGHCTQWSKSGSVLTLVDSGGVCGGGGGGASPPFADGSGNPLVKNASDTSKLMAFDISGFTTATTHTLTPQNANYILAGTNISNTFTGGQAFTGTVSMSGNPAISLAGEIQPTSDDVRSLGDTTHDFTSLFVHTIYNYVPSTALGIAATTSLSGVGIAITTTTAADMVFYPNTAEAFRIKANKDLLVSGGNIGFSNNSTQIGSSTNQALFIDAQTHYALDPANATSFVNINYNALYAQHLGTQTVLIDRATGTATLASLVGSGTRCLHASSGGVVSATTSDCGGGGGGGTSLSSTCRVITLSGSFQDECSDTATVTGYWSISASIQLEVFGPSSAAQCDLNINGTVFNPSVYGFSGLAVINVGASVVTQSTVTQTWVQPLNSGDSVKIQCAMAAGTGATNSGNYNLIYLHP